MNSDSQSEAPSTVLVLSRLVSLFFHPVFVTLGLFTFALFFAEPGQNAQTISRWLVFLCTLMIVVVLPVVQAAWLIRQGRISSWDMPDPAERRWPLITMVFLVIVLQGVFLLMEVSGLAGSLPLLGLGLTTTVFLVNLFWKISLHLVGLGSMSAFTLFLSPAEWSPRFVVVCVISLLLSLITAYARLKLKAHNPAQLVVGWIAGFAISFFFLMLFG